MRLLVVLLLAFGGCRNGAQVNPDDTAFWKVIDQGWKAAGFNLDLKEHVIYEQLCKETPAQIVAFEITLRKTLHDASTWQNIAAEDVMVGFVADDDFLYFRCGLIALGRQNFDSVMKDPDYLSRLAIPRDLSLHIGIGLMEFEQLLYVADNAYSTVTGIAKDDGRFPRDLAGQKGMDYDLDTYIGGVRWEKAEYPDRMPKLYKMFADKVAF